MKGLSASASKVGKVAIKEKYYHYQNNFHILCMKWIWQLINLQLNIYNILVISLHELFVIQEITDSFSCKENTQHICIQQISIEYLFNGRYSENSKWTGHGFFSQEILI